MKSRIAQLELACRSKTPIPGLECETNGLLSPVLGSYGQTDSHVLGINIAIFPDESQSLSDELACARGRLVFESLADSERREKVGYNVSG